MALYECNACERAEVLNTFVPDACSVCGGTMIVPEEERARQAAAIAEQNDRFRKTLNRDRTLTGRIVQTQGVDALGYQMHLKIAVALMEFDTFNEDNDPHGQHDFGVLTVEGQRFFWKIDYYDPHFEYGSDAPHDPAMTARVLTVMLPSEY